MENRPDENAVNHSTTLTNKQRGNEVTVRPATLDSESHTFFYIRFIKGRFQRHKILNIVF